MFKICIYSTNECHEKEVMFQLPFSFTIEKQSDFIQFERQIRTLLGCSSGFCALFQNTDYIDMKFKVKRALQKTAFHSKRDENSDGIQMLHIPRTNYFMCLLDNHQTFVVKESASVVDTNAGWPLEEEEEEEDVDGVVPFFNNKRARYVQMTIAKDHTQSLGAVKNVEKGAKIDIIPASKTKGNDKNIDQRKEKCRCNSQSETTLFETFQGKLVSTLLEKNLNK